MAQIFISYSRADTEADVARITDALARHFPSTEIFVDTNTLQPGDDWTRVVQKSISGASILLCVVGPNWKSSDAIELELRIALSSQIAVLPVLVRGADIGRLKKQAAGAFLEVADRHAVRLNHPTWQRDIEPLVALLRAILNDPSRARVIISPPDPDGTLRTTPSRSDQIELLNHAEDLAMCLDDPSVLQAARLSANAFAKERDAGRVYIGNGEYKYLTPGLVGVVMQARARLQVELYVRALATRQPDPIDGSLEFARKVSICLDDPSVTLEFEELLRAWSEGLRDYKEGGSSTSSDDLLELKEKIRCAVDRARHRLLAEIPGITRKYPERVWPTEALKGIEVEW